MNETANEKALIVDRAEVQIKESLAGLLDLSRYQVGPATSFCIALIPVVGFGKTEIKTWVFVPLIATAALPPQSRQVVKSDRGMCVSDASTLVTTGAEQDDLGQFLRFVTPAIVGSANDFAVVAPCVGKGVLVVRLVPVESEPRGFPGEMDTGK
jgi:hypothetical protein